MFLLGLNLVLFMFYTVLALQHETTLRTGTVTWWLRRTVTGSWSLKHEIIQRMKVRFGKTLSFLFSGFHSYSFVMAYKIKEWTNTLELSSSG